MKKLFAFAFCLLSLSPLNARDRENRRVRIINRSAETIYHLYASNVERGTWEEDLLGPLGVIGPNRYIDVNIDDGTGHCLFDLKVVTRNNSKAVRREFNVCTQSSWTIE